MRLWHLFFLVIVCAFLVGQQGLIIIDRGSLIDGGYLEMIKSLSPKELI